MEVRLQAGERRTRVIAIEFVMTTIVMPLKLENVLTNPPGELRCSRLGEYNVGDQLPVQPFWGNRVAGQPPMQPTR